ncbi:MAG: UbiA family prenyltransferase [Gemmatimonadaceae bacterium]
MSARSASAYLTLARWENGCIAAAGVLFGAWWVGWSGAARSVALAACAAFLLTAAANAWNDRADVAIDRQAHPARPIPSGTVDSTAAGRVAWCCAVAALVMSALISLLLALVTAGVVALMYAYSPWLKRSGLPGNIVVAVLASLPFLYGGWSAGRAAAALPLVALAVPLHFARELAKDLDDATADATVQRLTLPIRSGVRLTRGVLLVAAATFVLALLPWASSVPRFGLAVLPAVLLVMLGAARALRGHRGSPLVFKMAMVCAMVAFVIIRP